MYRLIGADGVEHASKEPGTLGGHRGNRIYGRLECRTAASWLARGKYAEHRVFFADEATAIAAGYRPCGHCLRDRYRRWKAGGVAALVVLALALAGCGGGKSGSGGGEHPLGQKVVLETTNAGAKTSPTTLAMTVKAVRKGAMKDLTAAGYTVDKDARDHTPYYVDVKYENTGTAPIKKQLDVGLEDGDGNLITSTVVFDFGNKPFAKCPRVFEGVLAPGKSYDACTLFLVKPDVTPKRVSFLPSIPGKATDFVYWKTA